MGPTKFIKSLVHLGKYLPLLVYVQVIVACQNNQERILPDEPAREKVSSNPFINTVGDTIPTGMQLLLTKETRELSTEVVPQAIPIPSHQKTVPAHPHIHPAGNPKVVPLRQDPERFTPGKNGLSYPDTFPAHQTVVPAIQSKPLTVAPMQMRDNTVANIQYLSVEEGLTNNIIHSILEDSRGNLWFGSRDETLTQYDGKHLSFFHNSEDVPEPSSQPPHFSFFGY